MRLHEIMGIESNRQWGVCSLNDFRKVSFSLTLAEYCPLTNASWL